MKISSMAGTLPRKLPPASISIWWRMSPNSNPTPIAPLCSKSSTAQAILSEHSPLSRQTDAIMSDSNSGEAMMQNISLTTIFDIITDFLASEPTAEEILAYHFPDDLQARVDELVERNGEGQ